MMGIYPYANKRALVYSMSQGDSEYQRLLNGLSVKEIQILKRHPDLIAKVHEITKFTQVQISAELREEYDLEVDEYLTRDQWIGTEKLEECLPDWFTSVHCGWYISSHDNEFEEWGRNFLMQEVRMNIWLRYLEHKKNPEVIPA